MHQCSIAIVMPSRCPVARLFTGKYVWIDKDLGACWGLAMALTVLDLFDQSSSVIHTTSGPVHATDLVREGRRLASGWSAEGLVAKDRVAVYADNSAGYLRCILAAAAGRFVLVSVNRRYSEHEARALVARSGATMAVTDADPSVFLEPPIGSLRRAIRMSSMVELPPEPIAQGERPEGDPTPDDPFVVFTTSGTTSAPKMVLHRHRSIAVHAGEAAGRAGLTDDDRVLVALPLCGVFGFNGLTIAVAANSEIWLTDRFEATEVADVVAAEAITVMNGSDDMFHRMLATSADLSSLRLGPYGRFNTSLDGVVGRAEQRGAVLTGVYGMSEVQALFSLRAASGTVTERERAGGALSSPHAAFRIADPDTSEAVDQGDEGELQLLGPSLFAGYLSEGGEGIDHALTAAAHVDADGQRWFRTGDLARAEVDGSFTYLTRMGDVLRLGGFLVSPAEIEAVILEWPGIEQAAAVAIPRPEGVRAAVMVVADHDPDQKAIIDHCRERLARYKVPIAVIRVDAFPTTASANGTKIRVTELRAMAETALVD